MPVVKKKCDGCHKPMLVGRVDTRYHGARCRMKVRQEDAKFEFPQVPQSGVPGVTFMRTCRRWSIKIKLSDGSWKYIGARRSLADAIDYQREISGGPTK